MPTSNFDDVVVRSLAFKDGGGNAFPVGETQPAITDPTFTGTAPVAITAAAPGAITSADPNAIVAAAGEPTAADLTLTQGMRTQVLALRADVIAIRAEVVKLVTDATALRTRIATIITEADAGADVSVAILDALREFSIIGESA